MREPQEIERLGLTQTPRRPVPGGVPPELDQPGLVRVQRQPEIRQSLAKVGQQSLRVVFMLETHDEESRRGESHPPPLAEPCGSLSAYTAPIVQPSGLRPKRQ